MNSIYYYASSTHPVHRGFISATPAEYALYSNVSHNDVKLIKQYEKSYQNMLTLVRSISKIVNFPRFTYINTDCHLIHTNSGILPLNKKPWITSIEYGNSFFLNPLQKTNRSSLLKSSVAYSLGSKYCKKILPYSRATRDSLLKSFIDYRHFFENKIDILYPSIIPQAANPKLRSAKDSPIKILFIGEFFRKGAKELLKAFEIIQQEHNVELYLKLVPYTNDPSRQKMAEKIITPYRKLKNIHIYDSLIPKYDLLNLYKRSDVFVLPTFGDFVPYSLLEAMSFGLPLISTNIFAIPEIINNNENGFLINIPEELNDLESFILKDEERIVKKYSIIESRTIDCVVDQLVKSLSTLIENPTILERMSARSQFLVTDGRFSIKERNRTLRKIYCEIFGEL